EPGNNSCLLLHYSSTFASLRLLPAAGASACHAINVPTRQPMSRSHQAEAVGVIGKRKRPKTKGAPYHLGMLRWIFRLIALTFATKLVNRIFGSRSPRARRV